MDFITPVEGHRERRARIARKDEPGDWSAGWSNSSSARSDRSRRRSSDRKLGQPLVQPNENINWLPTPASPSNLRAPPDGRL